MPLKSRQSADLSCAELRFLLREHDLTIEKDSPLSLLLDMEPEGDRAQLAQKGLLDKKSDWHDALIAISNPDFTTNSILAFTEMTVGSSYFVNRSNSNLIVSCVPTDGKQLNISFPWEPVDIIANTLAALVVDNNTPPPDFNIKMRFSPDGFTAFAAATDAVRAVMLASTLQRQQISQFQLPRQKLDEMLQMSSDDESVDARWLVTLFRSMAPVACISAENKVSDGGYKELVDLELIKIEDDDSWSPTSDLMGIALSWLVPLPAIYHEAVTTHLDATQELSSNLALRGSGPLCMVEFKNVESGSPKISLRTLKAEDYWLHLMGQMTPPEAEKKDAAEPSSNLSPAKDAVSCSSCGGPLQPGQKFCPECGTSVIAQQAQVKPKKEVQPTCSNCGKKLKPGIKFCTGCGTPL